MTRLIAALALLLMLIIPVGMVSAQNVINCDVPDSTLCQENDQTKSASVHDNGIYGSNGILTRAIQLLLVVVGIASVIMIIVGGFKYVISSGDAANVKSAKDTILYAVIGLVVAVMAQSIIMFVIGRF